MIAPSIVNEIKRLLAEGKHSQRGIARMIGVSRGTVGAIARGTRPDYEPQGPQHGDTEGSIGPPLSPEHGRSITASATSLRAKGKGLKKLIVKSCSGSKSWLESIKL